MRAPVALAVAAAAGASLLGAGACFVSIDDGLADRTDGAPADGATRDGPSAAEGGDGGTSSRCADASRPPVRADGGACPADMATIATDAGGYCIDLQEVSVGAYRAFLESRVPGCPESPTTCAWNVDFTPYGWTGTTPDRPSNAPIVGVTWCDAHVFCRWAGKRLCGKVGGGGASGFEPPAYFDPAESEWFRACSNRGTTKFPYGDTYVAGKCVGGDSVPTPTRPAPVDTPASCVGPTPGLIDMSGNASEWENSCGGRDEAKCDGGVECDFCHVRGGSFSFTGDKLACADGDNDPRKAKDSEIGIRCCAD